MRTDGLGKFFAFSVPQQEVRTCENRFRGWTVQREFDGFSRVAMHKQGLSEKE
jgi:hypothetical protein